MRSTIEDSEKLADSLNLCSISNIFKMKLGILTSKLPISKRNYISSMQKPNRTMLSIFMAFFSKYPEFFNICRRKPEVVKFYVEKYNCNNVILFDLCFD